MIEKEKRIASPLSFFFSDSQILPKNSIVMQINNITSLIVCHNLFILLLWRKYAIEDNAIVMMLCYVMLLIIYSILFYSIWKVIIYKPYDITLTTLCYSLGVESC